MRDGDCTLCAINKLFLYISEALLWDAAGQGNSSGVLGVHHLDIGPVQYLLDSLELFIGELQLEGLSFYEWDA